MNEWRMKCIVALAYDSRQPFLFLFFINACAFLLPTELLIYLLVVNFLFLDCIVSD